jgi:hypothetical protein
MGAAALDGGGNTNSLTGSLVLMIFGHVASDLADMFLDVREQMIDDEARGLQARSRIPARRIHVEIRITQSGQRRG